MSEQESLQNQLDKVRRLLYILEEQAAVYTNATIPAYLQLELEDQRKKATDLEKRLANPTAQNSPSTPEPATHLRVFLCHYSKDKPAVLELYERLSKLPWVKPWLDKKELIPGQNWPRLISQAVRDNHIVLVCLSKSSINHQGFVQKEITKALDVALAKPVDSIYLIPLRLEECDVPEQIADWQWVDYFEEDGFDLLLKGLRLGAEQLGIQVTPPPAPKLEPEKMVIATPIPKPEPARVPEVLKPVSQSPKPAPVIPEQEKLLREIAAPRTDHKRRLEIGDLLDKLGDPRPGVGLRQDGTPDIAWLPVTPGGQITIEKEKFTVQPFYIAKYLITYAQYEAFVKDPNGYNNPEWWQGMPSQYQPQKLDAQNTKFKNSPRDTISWYQSVAFTRWLNQRLKGWQFPTPGSQAGVALIIGQNAQVRLPTEWEWQWVAQGGRQQKAYPWGQWQAGYANTAEAGLERTTAVGLYPQGAAVCGAMDLSGNLWEWCGNKHSKPQEIQVDASGDSRVWRGGAFYYNREYAACAYRYYNYPYFASFNCGFRLVVAFPYRATLISEISVI